MSCPKCVKHVCMVFRLLLLLPAIVVLVPGFILYSFYYDFSLTICNSYRCLILVYLIVCAILFVLWLICGKGKAEKNKTTKPPTSVVGRSLTRGDLYKATIDLIIHAENITWTRSSNFLLANSILMLAWATIFASSLWDQRKAVFLSLLSGLGFVLSFVWAPFSYRSRRYLKSYKDRGIELEQNLSPPLQEGPLSAGERIPFSYIEEITKSEHMSWFIPLAFAAVFLAAFLKSLCLIVAYIF